MSLFSSAMHITAVARELPMPLVALPLLQCPPLHLPAARYLGDSSSATASPCYPTPRDFRHEKTKKKRGSYLGGAIDPHATFSYKFDSDDE